MTDTTPPQLVNDMPELYAVQRAITNAGGTLTPDVHKAIDALRETWDRELKRAQAEAFQYRTALQGTARAAVPVPPTAPADRAAILREAEVALRAQGKHLVGEFNDSDILHEDGPASAVATWQRAADLLRRMADEAQQLGACPGCGCAEHRGFCDACGCLDSRTTSKAQQQTQARRCGHNDIVYGQCIRPIPHDGECFHERQPARIDEETDEDSLCGSEYPGDANFAGQLCGLPNGHFGDHRCDEEIAGTKYTAGLRWPAAVSQPGKEA